MGLRLHLRLVVVATRSSRPDEVRAQPSPAVVVIVGIIIKTAIMTMSRSRDTTLPGPPGPPGRPRGPRAPWPGNRRFYGHLLGLPGAPGGPRGGRGGQKRPKTRLVEPIMAADGYDRGPQNEPFLAKNTDFPVKTPVS